MTPVDVRAQLVRALEADLVGPFDQTGHELLPLPPSRWYLTGFLAPSFATHTDPDDPDAEGELAAGGESQAEDAGDAEPAVKRRQHFPASLGLSVFLPACPSGHSPDTLSVDVRYADYEKETFETNHGKTKTGWRRLPSGPHRVEIPLEAKAVSKGVSLPDSELRVTGELRDTDIDGLPGGSRVLSLFLVNGRQPVEHDRDRKFIFQVQMTLRYSGGFLPRPNRQGEAASEDDPRVLALQFRDRCEWAVGHNTSVVEPTPNAEGHVYELSTTQLPRHEVRQVRHEAIAGFVTRMSDLQKMDGPSLGRALSPLLDAYDGWIEKQRYQPLERSSLEETRDALMKKASRARERIKAGIRLLQEDEQVLRAFKDANGAMYVAALQADRWREDRRYTGEKRPEWRPFQLAFLLMNLPSVADPQHADREIADLIYFPTGGGKTEAYLGLVAFTLLLRRLRRGEEADGGRGVSVILRYTLRLLTLDQLGRAATLICALDQLREKEMKRNGIYGEVPFRVGLWVGQSTTANWLKDVNKALNDYVSGQKESPCPLSSCPWCGTDLKIGNIKLVGADGKPNKTRYVRAVVYCSKIECLYSERNRPGEGLPVLFVDEQIYRELPDFLVATVDKFAMMPWLGAAGTLFGRAVAIDESRAYGVMDKVPQGATRLGQGLLPPELIIQDEMHLISGPLGTMVGLYETAVDYLCEREVDGERRVPKVVCSTATVRRAREQIRALFERDLAIFPPRGIDDGDNFFATVERDRPGRLYLGVAAPGRALRAVSVRVYATLLAAAQKHFDPEGAPDQAADPYMTLIGYFNSLRELGGMRRLVEDEVATRAGKLATEKRPMELGEEVDHPWAADRKLIMPAELTSREPTERVKETKQRLATRRAVPKPPEDDPLPDAEPHVAPLDTVLASNMISVGLDVDRLGLMVVAGQPKTTSEYIQATSRVGRAYPGLVVTCLNAARPRDRSHFERFVAYHESFYREVEATSVTPFSLQTLDRGMVGTLLSMIRHGVGALRAPNGIMGLHDHRALAEQILEAFVARGRDHREWADATAEKRIEEELRTRGRNFLDAWEQVVKRGREAATERTYSPFDRAKHLGKSVMYTATDPPPVDGDERRFMAPTSMRDVEAETHLWKRFLPLDERN